MRSLIAGAASTTTRTLGLPCIGLRLGVRVMHGLLHRRPREPWAAAAFGGMPMRAAPTLFPQARPPAAEVRWPADMIATSVGTHAADVTAVAVVDDAVRRTL